MGILGKLSKCHSTMTLKISIAVGIDVGKQFLDVHHSRTRARARFDNDPEGIASLLDWLWPPRGLRT